MRKLCWICVSVAVLSGCGSGADGAPFDASKASSGSAPVSSGPTSAASEPATNDSDTAPRGVGPALPTSAASSTPAAASGSMPAAPSNSESAKEVPVAPATNGSGGSAPSSPPSEQQASPPSKTSSTPPANAPPTTSPPAPAAALDATQCASYDTGFLPLVQAPVCSSCHGGGGRLPSFATFTSASALCTQIGREVSSGAMPPSGGLSNEQRAIVASWVGGGCPETAAEAAQSCAPTNGSNPNPNAPAPAASGNPTPNAPAAAPAPAQGGEDGENGSDDGGEQEDG